MGELGDGTNADDAEAKRRSDSGRRGDFLGAMSTGELGERVETKVLACDGTITLLSTSAKVMAGRFCGSELIDAAAAARRGGGGGGAAAAAPTSSCIDGSTKESPFDGEI